MGAISALISFLIVSLNMFHVSGAGARAMSINFHAAEEGKVDRAKVTNEMSCPGAFPRRGMDGCCRWTSPPPACAKKKLQKKKITAAQCMAKLCGNGKHGWSLYKPDSDGPPVMNVCCNPKLSNLQEHIETNSGFSAPRKAAVARGSMDAFDPTVDDPVSSKDQSRNIALLLLFLTLGLFALKQKGIAIPFLEKKQAGPPTQEFGLPSGSKANAALVALACTSKGMATPSDKSNEVDGAELKDPVGQELPMETSFIDDDDVAHHNLVLEGAKEPLISFGADTDEPLCAL